MSDLIKFENGKLADYTIYYIQNAERRIKELKEQYDQFKADLLEFMEQNGFVKLEAENLKISYVAESERESFDSKQFKADMPKLYDEYVKFTKVKPSIRIKVD